MDSLRIRYMALKEEDKRWKAFRAPFANAYMFAHYYELKLIEKLIIYGEVDTWAFTKESFESDGGVGDKFEVECQMIGSLDFVEVTYPEPLEPGDSEPD